MKNKWYRYLTASQYTKEKNRITGKTVLICTQTKSLCEVPRSLNVCVYGAQMLLNIIQVYIIIQRIPWHLNIPGSYLTDRAMKQTTELPLKVDISVLFSRALNVIKNLTWDPAITHNQTTEIYTRYCSSIDAVQIITREDELLIARLSSGITLHIRSWYQSCLSKMERRSSDLILLAHNMLTWWTLTAKGILLS